MPAISIIIPCYNASEWIDATLKSVSAQTYEDWEIIAVDDGSSDSTLRILRKHAQRDARVRVFKQNNAGVSAARNTALSHASGDFYFFLDSDDLIPRRTLELLSAVIVSQDADIADGQLKEFHSPVEAIKFMNGPEDKGLKCISGHEAVEWSLYQRRVTASMGGKIYKKILFEDILFPEGEIYEDLSVFYKVALRARRFAMIDGVTYLYRQRPDSQIHTFNPGRLKVLDATRRIQENLSGDPILLAAAHDRRLAAAFNMLGLLLNDKSLPEERRTAAVMQCRAIIKAFRCQSLTGSKVRLKNRIGAALSLFLPEKLMDNILRRQYK